MAGEVLDVGALRVRAGHSLDGSVQRSCQGERRQAGQKENHARRAFMGERETGHWALRE